VIPPPGFEWVRDGRARFLVRSDLRTSILPLLRAAAGDWAGYATRALSGGRGGVRVVHMTDHQVVVRPYRRGGLPSRVFRDTYFGLTPRPFRELCVTEALRRQGIPTVEVYGASVRWLVPGCYKGWLATRYVSGACTFWEWICAAPAARERAAVLASIGKATRRLHDTGARHPDLNLNNILIRAAASSPSMPEVWFIDFDRARVAGPCRRTSSADLARLRRSARKLDPEGARLTAADLDCLEAAYRDARSENLAVDSQ
jgi:3-deoxy-D-manno-octulosonic acid kinase